MTLYVVQRFASKVLDAKLFKPRFRIMPHLENCPDKKS